MDCECKVALQNCLDISVQGCSCAIERVLEPKSHEWLLPSLSVIEDTVTESAVIQFFFNMNDEKSEEGHLSG